MGCLDLGIPIRYILRMKLTTWSVSVLLLMAVLFPSGAAVVIAVHLGSHHDHHHRVDARPTEAVQLVMHGHHHEPGTPPHEHSIVVTKLAVPITKPSLLMILATSVGTNDVLLSPATIPLARLTRFALDPLALDTNPILRI